MPVVSPSTLFGPLRPDPVVAAQPVGEVVEVASGKHGLATATFDATYTFRYRLSRVWDPAGTRCVFMLLNPSTADHHRLDPTVRRCVGFAHDWGHGALEVVNIFALRSTDPAGLRTAPDPVGPGNDDALLAAARAADQVVVGWGTHGTYRDRHVHVSRLLAGAGLRVKALRTTKDGHPGHPLYLRSDSACSSWPGPKQLRWTERG